MAKGTLGLPKGAISLCQFHDESAPLCVKFLFTSCMPSAPAVDSRIVQERQYWCGFPRLHKVHQLYGIDVAPWSEHPNTPDQAGKPSRTHNLVNIMRKEELG